MYPTESFQYLQGLKQGDPLSHSAKLFAEYCSLVFNSDDAVFQGTMGRENLRTYLDYLFKEIRGGVELINSERSCQLWCMISLIPYVLIDGNGTWIAQGDFLLRRQKDIDDKLLSMFDSKTRGVKYCDKVNVHGLKVKTDTLPQV
ncbi:hypothetical protein Tco_0935416 [Tanacetum coccineum]